MNNPSLRCASYARYSTDKQNPLSTLDQIAKLREFAAVREWEFCERFVYTDEETSGATLERPGLRELLAAAESKPRPFDTLLIEDASRLSRKQADVLNLCERLNFAGIKICFVSQGVDSGDEKFQILLLVRGMMDQLFISDTAKRVRRGMEGLIRRGLHTGGTCFGYRSRKGADGSRLEIYEPHAAIVRHIYEMYASGIGVKTIARRLNAEGVESPSRSGRHCWAPPTIYEMIKNRRYTGVMTWGAAFGVRDPRTGRKVRRRSKDGTAIETPAPHLRIVSDELWAKVAERRELVKHVFKNGGARPGLLRAGAMRSPYMFSGLLHCGSCGHAMHIVGSYQGTAKRRERRYYGCPVNYRFGKCSNGVRILHEDVEKQLLAGLQKKIAAAPVVAYVLDQVERGVAKAFADTGDSSSGLRRRRLELELEVGRLADGLARGTQSPVIVEEINRREREIALIKEKLPSSKSAVSVRSNFKKLRAVVVNRIQNLPEYLATDAGLVRAHFLRHAERIELRPDGLRCIAKGDWDLVGCVDLTLECPRA